MGVDGACGGIRTPVPRTELSEERAWYEVRQTWYGYDNGIITARF